jgi:prepilin-type N-terminal cleavage/methylation domain-containing protein
MSHDRRGFTLIELAAVITIVVTVTGLLNAFYIEVRSASASVEARVRLEREATAIAERLGRDLRSATSVTPEGHGFKVDTERGSLVRYELEGDALFRDDGERQYLGSVTSMTRSELPSGPTQIDLQLERPIGMNRHVRIHRRVLIARRK